MNLRDQARQDLAFTLSDDVEGFGWPMVLIDQDGAELPLVGQSGDIAILIDPDTGTAIAGRTAHFALQISQINAAVEAGTISGFPEGINEADLKPWKIRFDDLEGATYTFKIVQTFPDRTLGLLSGLLGVYQNAS